MTKGAKNNLTVTIFLFTLFLEGSCLAGDLDDGISKYTDESISADDSLGQANTNVNFIVVKALSDSKKKQKKDENSGGGIGRQGGNQDHTENSVIVGPGSKTGDIINIQIDKK
ncbi:MAG: hypothetical protein ACE5FU_01885 [Nitrospinota bacterium]